MLSLSLSWKKIKKGNPQSDRLAYSFTRTSSRTAMLVEDIKRLGPLGIGDGDKKGRGIETGRGDGARPQFLNTHPVAGLI